MVREGGWKMRASENQRGCPAIYRGVASTGLRFEGRKEKNEDSENNKLLNIKKIYDDLYKNK